MNPPSHTDPDGQVLAVVIGRAGSKGLPRKNALPVCGVPMIAHTIRFARASPGEHEANGEFPSQATGRKLHGSGLEAIILSGV